MTNTPWESTLWGWPGPVVPGGVPGWSVTHPAEVAVEQPPAIVQLHTLTVCCGTGAAMAVHVVPLVLAQFLPL